MTHYECMNTPISTSLLASFPGSHIIFLYLRCSESQMHPHTIKVSLYLRRFFMWQKIPGSPRLHNFNVCILERGSLGMRLSHYIFHWVLTYDIHHSRGITTDPPNTVIGKATVGPSVTRAQNKISGAPTITVIVTTRHRAAATCWSPAVSYLTSCTHSSAR